MVDELIRSRRRSVSLQVDGQGRVIARAPLHMPAQAVEDFALSKAPWIQKRRRELAMRPKWSFAHGERFPLAGSWFTLRLSPDCRRRRFTGQELILPPGTAEETCGRVTAFYKEIAHEVFRERIALYAPRVGVRPGPVRVSGAATRWGSCGRDDSINLNWRLLMAPKEEMDYVVVHELCHILRRDHSPAFWAQVERIMPQWKQQRKWLREHREELQLCTAFD